MDTKTFRLNAFSELIQSAEHIHISFSSPQRALSSATLNGGLVNANHILNRKVCANTATDESPEQALQSYANKQGWRGCTVGMMTAAPMSTLSIAHDKAQGVEVTVIATTGLNNARRAGDKADVQEILRSTEKVGTINLILICSATLTEAAMVEAIMIATEAKAAVLQEASIISPVSEKLATGTGTDATVMVSGQSAEEIAYCGKHVLLGELIGRLTIQALTQSLSDVRQ